MRPFLTTVVVLGLSCLNSAFAQTSYFVDAVNGSDTNPGTSETSAWKTISKVNKSSFNPGDKILFKCGEIWREQLNIPSSGSADSPMLFGCYGSGAKPIIDGADLVSGWTGAGLSNVWQAACGTNPYVVMFDGTKGANVTAKTALSSSTEWYWEGDMLFVYSTSSPDSAYSNPGIAASARDYAVYCYKNYVAIENLDIRGANNTGIYLRGTGLKLENCTVRYNNVFGVNIVYSTYCLINACIIHANEQNGIHFGGVGSVNGTVQYCTIDSNRIGDGIVASEIDGLSINHNTLFQNGSQSTDFSHMHNIYMSNSSAGIDNVTVEYNDIHDAGTGHGIAFQSNNGSVRYNRIYNNNGSGILLDNQYAAGTVNVYYNVCYGNNRGICLYDYNFNAGTHVNIYSNTTYNNTQICLTGTEPAELQIEINLDSLFVKNNIFYHTTQDNAIIWSVYQPHLYSDYNCILQLGTPPTGWPLVYDNVSRTWAAWKSSTGGDAHSLYGDAMFVSTSDFHLQTGSPCIEGGTNVGLTADIEGTSVPQGRNPNIGAYEKLAQPITLTSNVSHGIVLPQGWSMISSFVQPSESALDGMLGGIVPRMVIMKDGAGHVFWPAFTINSIGTWNYRNGYQIYMQSTDTLTITGNATLPEAMPLPLVQGVNLVAYLRNTPMSADSALASLQGILLIAKNNAGQVYWPAYGINTIGSLRPGQGYQVQVTQASALTYPANTVSAPPFILTKQQGIANATGVPLPVHYRPSVSNTGASAILLIQSPELGEGDEIAVWTASKMLVGSGMVSQGKALITVWGHNRATQDSTDGAGEGETLSLTIWSAAEQKEGFLTLASVTDALPGAWTTNALRYKTDAVWVARVTQVKEIPKTFTLSQNYPNPFNPSSVIRYGLPYDVMVTLEIFNILGQRVALVVNEEQEAGYHEAVFQNSTLGSGVYFYRLIAGRFADTKRMLLLK